MLLRTVERLLLDLWEETEAGKEMNAVDFRRNKCGGKWMGKGIKNSSLHVQPAAWYTCQTFPVPDWCSLYYFLIKLCGFFVDALCGQLYVYLLYGCACECVLSLARGWTLVHEPLLHCKIWVRPCNKEVVPGCS